MSPIIARAAMRNATRRQFSIMTHVRAAARQFEPHPFQRLPVTEKPQGADWAKMIKRSGKTAAVYFPGMALVLGWPLAYQGMANGHI